MNFIDSIPYLFIPTCEGRLLTLSVPSEPGPDIVRLLDTYNGLSSRINELFSRMLSVGARHPRRREPAAVDHSPVVKATKATISAYVKVIRRVADTAPDTAPKAAFVCGVICHIVGQLRKLLLESDRTASPSHLLSFLWELQGFTVIRICLSYVSAFTTCSPLTASLPYRDARCCRRRFS